MNITYIPPAAGRCPVCGDPLKRDAKIDCARCQRGHVTMKIASASHSLINQLDPYDK